MQVKEIIIKACDFTENDELSKALLQEGELTEEMQNNLERLIKCFNLVHEEIVSEYLPVLNVERVKTENGRVKLDFLKAKISHIIAVKDVLGDNIKYDKFENYIMTSEYEVEIWYNSLPNELTIDDEFSTSLPARVYAYAVVREYYFLQTLYEDAKVWDERFLASIENFARKKGETVLPRRRWI